MRTLVKGTLELCVYRGSDSSLPALLAAVAGRKLDGQRILLMTSESHDFAGEAAESYAGTAIRPLYGVRRHPNVSLLIDGPLYVAPSADAVGHPIRFRISDRIYLLAECFCSISDSPSRGVL